MTDLNNTAQGATKKTRTPKDKNSILVGALRLPLADRVQLVKDLQKSITDEVNSLTNAAKEAANIANGNA